MHTAVKIKDPKQFAPLYNRPKDVWLCICIGGRGGKKTYEVSKFATVDATVKRRRVAVVRDEKETIRETILNEIFTRFDTANKYGHFNGLYTKTQQGIRDDETGDMLVFTKGFRASSLQKTANMKGISEVDTAIVEEAEDIRQASKFNTFVDSIRTQERFIVVILNTPDIQHWIVRRYFNLEPLSLADVPELAGKVQAQELDGYWRLLPKALPGFMCIQTSYEQNEHLPQSVIDSYRTYGDPTSPTYDLHYYLTAIKGFASSGRKGQVIRKAKPIKLAEYMALPFKEIYGLDFGTSSPAGIVGVKIDGPNLYARQLNYLPMSHLQIGVFFARLGIKPSDVVIADSADSLGIGKLRRGWKAEELPEDIRKEFPNGIPGLQRLHGAIKGPESIQYGVGILTGYNIFIAEESTDFWDETFNWIYATNKEGEYTNDPIDEHNHLWDPTRYIAQSKGRFF